LMVAQLPHWARNSKEEERESKGGGGGGGGGEEGGGSGQRPSLPSDTGSGASFTLERPCPLSRKLRSATLCLHVGPGVDAYV